MTENKPNIIAIDGGKKNSQHGQPHNTATLEIDNETVVLDRFVLSGVNSDGKNCLLTFNCTLEELMVYSMTLDTMVRDKIRESMP